MESSAATLTAGVESPSTKQARHKEKEQLEEILHTPECRELIIKFKPRQRDQWIKPLQLKLPRHKRLEARLPFDARLAMRHCRRLDKVHCAAEWNMAKNLAQQVVLDSPASQCYWLHAPGSTINAPDHCEPDNKPLNLAHLFFFNIDVPPKEYPMSCSCFGAFLNKLRHSNANCPRRRDTDPAAVNMPQMASPQAINTFVHIGRFTVLLHYTGETLLMRSQALYATTSNKKGAALYSRPPSEMRNEAKQDKKQKEKEKKKRAARKKPWKPSKVYLINPLAARYNTPSNLRGMDLPLCVELGKCNADGSLPSNTEQRRRFLRSHEFRKAAIELTRSAGLSFTGPYKKNEAEKLHKALGEEQYQLNFYCLDSKEPFCTFGPSTAPMKINIWRSDDKKFSTITNVPACLSII